MSMSPPEAFGIRAVDDDEDDAVDADDDDLIGDVRGFLPRKRLILLLLPFVVDVIVVVGVPSRLCCLFRDAAVLLI